MDNCAPHKTRTEELGPSNAVLLCIGRYVDLDWPQGKDFLRV